MKLKRQISKHKYDRLLNHPDSKLVVAYYRFQEDFYKAHVSNEAFLLDNYIYAKVECKKLKNVPTGCVQHTSTYCRYAVEEGMPRADSLAFHVLGKANIF